MGVGAQHCPFGLHALWGLRAAGVAGGRPRGGWPATVVRGAWCQALSLPRPPVSWSGQPGFCDLCVPGAVDADAGTQHRFHSVRPCGPALPAVGWRKGVRGGGAFHHCEGRLRSGAVPLPTARPLGGLLGSATNVLWARVCGCGGQTLSPWPACPVGAACRGGGGGPSPGGVACHRCEGRLVSGAVPPPAARPLERAARVPRPVCPGCGRCGRGDPAPASQGAPLRAGIARCGGGGRASPGGCLPPLWGASEARCRPSPNCPLTERAVGVRHPRAVGADVWLWEPNTVSLACMPSGGCMPRGWLGAVPGGVACHRCEARLVSGAVPPPAARPLARAARVPRPVCPGCGRCGRGDPVPAPQRVLLLAGVARCGAGGRASPGGVPSTIVRGVWGEALSLPRLPAHWAGCWGPPPTCCGRGCVGVGAQHCLIGLHALWGLRAAGVVGGRPRGGWPATVVRGAWCQALSLPRLPVLWSGQLGFRDPCVPAAVDAGVGTEHRPQGVHPCGPALLAVGVAEGRPRGGCLPPL